VNIHYIGAEKVDTITYRRRTGETKATSKGTNPPRTRSDIGKTNGSMGQGTINRIQSSSVYPGGKQLRRAMATITRRRNDHDNIGKNSRGKNSHVSAYNKPGSMKVRAR
jgi:hypothetical protein